ncbi:MAG: alpha-L-arabinofuranosidase [Ardenticatenaceae bacterium]|nr:alpha-L-arabinofuranosidase [Ardenticatenaceae bacterium]
MVACQTPVENTPAAPPTLQSLFVESEATETAVPSTLTPVPTEEAASIEATHTHTPPLEPNVTITINHNDTAIPLNPHILGSNLPIWLTKDRMTDSNFLAQTQMSGLSLIRIPGGSWSNYYDWLACERNGFGIDEEAECYWPWAAHPTDLLNFLQETNLTAMYTINMNGTAKEAAALVAFFNGSVTDETVIGLDVRGRDWGQVSDWAQLRSDNGNPQPIGIQYWEIGNEIYGGKGDSGTDCVPFGWEDVWTCDGTEYVNGLGEGTDRKEGYLEYREAMQAVDPAILVGAVGIPIQDDWKDWGNEVIAAAGDVMDFYIIHQYAFFDPPNAYATVLAEPFTTWPTIMADVQAAFDQYADGREVPVAVTEYNLFSVQDQDNEQLMTRMVNALFMADTVGQMAANGVQIAAQWDLSNGQAGNGTDYGLIHADTYQRYPQYYAYKLWSHFGSELLPVSTSVPADTVLSVYAGRLDEATLTILAINKTGEPIASAILLADTAVFQTATADVLTADSLDAQTITFNGQTNPAVDFSNAPSLPLPITDNPFTYTFAPYSITLLQLTLDS